MTRLTSSRENFACLLEVPRTTNHCFRKFVSPPIRNEAGRELAYEMLYASSEQLGIGYIFPDPESELETLGKARREKLTSEHRAIRGNYPAQDGQYRGYQETVDAQVEL
ncbi:unnamed protein product [Boreogadus saida]